MQASDLDSYLQRGGYVREEFTPAEEALLLRFFTNVDRPVFALMNLPEVVKGALFARYSRSEKSIRRLFLDEFAPDLLDGSEPTADTSEVGVERATALYRKVFSDYGDDSVAQLGGVHVACEQASNVLSKLIERPRLASFLEQSTRYVPLDTKVTTSSGPRWRYHLDPSLPEPAAPAVADALDGAFADYVDLLERLQEHLHRTLERPEGTSERAWAASVRARALDGVRGVLPAATRTNIGIYASGQAYEALVLRLRSHPLPEAQVYGQLLLEELRKVIPSFLDRVDRPDRGGVWAQYLSSVRSTTSEITSRVTGSVRPARVAEVELVEYDPAGEDKVVAAVLYPASDLPLGQLEELVSGMDAGTRSEILEAAVGDRTNRRHRPGRAFEATSYCFDVLADYGAFRDLQRHRLLTVEWQTLTTEHGYVMPGDVVSAGLSDTYRSAMERADRTHALLLEHAPAHAPYAVSLAYRVRFLMRMNAREAMHVLELRTAPAGHPAYRQVCQEMHDLIGQKHPALAATMQFVDHSAPDLGRLDAESRKDAPRA